MRRVFLDEARMDLGRPVDELGGTLGEALLRPTRIYVRALRRLAASGLMKGAAHITGGGLVENPTRMLPAGARLKLRIDPRVRLLERMLAQVFEYDWWKIHEEAERLEHAISDDFERPRKCAAPSTWASA